MFSMPHIVVIFIVVLVLFGPHKLPELARGLGKMMAEFRKASTDFRLAFEEEMRNIERQAREAELKKIQDASAATAPEQTATLATPSDAERILPAVVEPAEPIITPVTEAVARESHSPDVPPVTEGTPPAASESPAIEATDAEAAVPQSDSGASPSHDQRPA